MIRLLWDRTQHRFALLMPGKSPENKMQGRSAYVCAKPECVKQALRFKRLAKALKTAIPSDIVELLSAWLDGGGVLV